MVNTLWTFGDSYTEGFGLPWSKKYIDWKGYKPKSFGELLSRELQLVLKNLGKGGSDNHTIFESICKNIDQIRDDDMVIIGWSNSLRFRLATNSDTWANLLPGDDPDLSLFDNISKQTIEEIHLNRASYKFAHEIDSWIKIINKALLKTDVIHWTPFGGSIPTCEFIRCSIISEESEGVVQNGHYGEDGHKELFNIFKERYTKPIIKRPLI
jgi:hypothetical protein